MTQKLRLSDVKTCFAVPGAANAIDAVHPVTGKGVWSGETLEQIRERYPNAEIVTYEQIEANLRDKYTKPPRRITAARWDYMLGVLPPVQWVHARGAETFKISELDAGDITAIFCRVGEQYFELHDSNRLSHEEIVERCLAV